MSSTAPVTSKSLAQFAPATADPSLTDYLYANEGGVDYKVTVKQLLNTLTANGAQPIITVGVPAATVGLPGQVAIDPTNGNVYGPKTATGWGSATAIAAGTLTVAAANQLAAAQLAAKNSADAAAASVLQATTQSNLLTQNATTQANTIVATANAQVANVQTAANNAVAQVQTAAASGPAFPNSAASTVPSTIAASSTYWVVSADGSHLLLYQNKAGVATFLGVQVAVSGIIDAIQNYVASLQTTLTTDDDVYWAVHYDDANGNVTAGADKNGKWWFNDVQVVNALTVNQLVVAALSISSLQIKGTLTIGNFVEITETDTQYETYMVDKNGVVFWGTIGGVVQAAGGSAGTAGVDTTARKMQRMYGRNAILPGPIVAWRPGQNQDYNTSVGESTRLRIQFFKDCTNIIIQYCNERSQSGAAPNNYIKVSSAIQYPVGGTRFPVYFPGGNSDRSVTLQPHDRIFSRPLGLEIPAGALVDVHTTVTTGPDFTSGGTGTYPKGGIMTQAASGIDWITQSSTVDYTLVDQPSPNSNQFCYSPTSIHGVAVDGSLITQLMLICGDSISQGAGDSSNWAQGQDMGLMQRACHTAGVGYLSQGANGIPLSQMSQPADCRWLVQLASSCTCALVVVGTNDLAQSTMTAATLIANYKLFWAAIRATGCKVVQATIPPRTTSTDTFTTTKNQTAINSNFGPEVSGGSPRQIVNTFLRGAVAAGLIDGLVDFAAMVEYLEPTNNTYVWNMPYGGDGIHPSSAYCISVAAAVPATGAFNF